MYALIKNNEIIQLAKNPKSFFPNVSFPKGVPTRDFLTANGVKEVVEGERKDERFYWVTPAQPSVQLVDGTPTRLYVNTPKDLEQLKEQYIAQAKQTAGAELLTTDWMVVRKYERNIDIPANVVSDRANAVTKCETTETNITNATTIEELIEVLYPVVVVEDVVEEQEEVVVENNEEEVSVTSTSSDSDNEQDVVV